MTAITADDPDPSVVGRAGDGELQGHGQRAGGGAPSGNVTVTDGSAHARARSTPTSARSRSPRRGPKSLTATYAGDDLYDASPPSAAVSHQVNRADTTTTISSHSRTRRTSASGDRPLQRLAHAPGTGTPTGNVTVSDGTDSCTATVAAGECAITFTTAGTRSLTATYLGNGPSRSTLRRRAAYRQPVRHLERDHRRRSGPVGRGEPVTVRYSVSASEPGAGTPTGTVTVNDGVDSCTATVAAGQCTITLTTVGAAR